jgi:hypothetical protein
MVEIRDDERLPERAVLVGLCLATYMNADGFAYPSLTTLARAARRGRDTVIRALDDLEAARWLQRERGGSPKGGSRTPTKYRADLSQIVRLVPADLSHQETRLVAPRDPDLSHSWGPEVSIKDTREGAPRVLDERHIADNPWCRCSGCENREEQEPHREQRNSEATSPVRVAIPAEEVARER